MKMKIEIKWLVWVDEETQSINASLYRESMNGIEITVPTRVRDDGIIEYQWREILEGDDLIPTFTLPRMMMRLASMQDLIDGLCNVSGVKPSHSPVDEPVLKATLDHLETFKRIMFDSQFVEVQRGIEREPEAMRFNGYEIPQEDEE